MKLSDQIEKKQCKKWGGAAVIAFSYDRTCNNSGNNNASCDYHLEGDIGRTLFEKNKGFSRQIW